MNYRTVLLSFIFLLALNTSYSQAGLKLAYHNEQSDNPLFIDHPHLLSVGIDYRIRILNDYLTIQPAISYLSGLNKVKNHIPGNIGISAPINFYPFFISSDCDCPELKKKKENIFKNLYLSFVPTYYLNLSEYKGLEAFEIQKIFLGLGLGIDIPVARHILLSPGVTYQFWNYLSDLELELEGANETSRIFNAEIRIGYYW